MHLTILCKSLPPWKTSKQRDSTIYFFHVGTVYYQFLAVSSVVTYLNLHLVYKYYSYLVTIMGLVIPWSFTLALVDGYSVLVKCSIRQPGVLLIIIVGDWVCRI